MLDVHSVAQVRAAEDTVMAELPSGALMQRASFALAVACADLLREVRGSVVGSRIALLIGGGNNGGDALFAGAYLSERGADVRAYLLTSTPHAAGRQALLRAGGRVQEWSEELDLEIGDADLVLDGLVGIGGRGALREPMAECARIVNALGNLVVAVDIPSGVDADTGAVAGEAIAADVTVTFGTLKSGLLVMPGKAQAGQIELVDIGLEDALADLGAPTAECLEAVDVGALLDAPSLDAHKYSRGVVGVIAGSPDYPGAALLSVGAARLSGVGMVRFLERADVRGDLIVQAYPGVVVGTERDPRVGCWLIGPGFAGTDSEVSVLNETLASSVPIVLDAGALTVLGRHEDLLDALRARTAPTVLTPHDGEFRRIAPACADLLAVDRIGAATAAARDLNAVVVLKGAGTVIASSSGETCLDLMGTADLATAGSGDVLAGLVAGLIAAGGPVESLADAALLAAAGVYLHGVAGQLAAESTPEVTAADLLDALPESLDSVS